MLVTARPPRWVDALASGLACHAVTICENGALVYDAAAHVVLEEHPIDPRDASGLVARLREALPGCTFAVERSDGFGHEPGYATFWPIPPGALVDQAEALVAGPVTKLLARAAPGTSPAGLLERAAAAVGTLGEVSMSSNAGLVEVAARGVSKATALKGVLAELGVRPEEVIAFGDMLNDLPMLALAGWSVAVANAHPAVRAIADEVTAACGEDGVARVLERVVGAGPGADASLSRA